MITEFLNKNPNLIYWILGSILIPGLYVWWQTRQGKKIAVAGRVYDKAIMEINAIYRLLQVNTELNLFVGINFKIGNQFAILHVPMYFNNRGNKSLENVSFRIEFSKDSELPIENLSFKSTNKGNLNSYRNVIKDEKSISILYDIGDMTPETGQSHEEIIKINKNMIGKRERFSIIMHAKDQLPLVADINLHIINSNDLKSVMEYALKIHYSLIKKIDYLLAIPESKNMAKGKLKYQECFIKKSLRPAKIKNAIFTEEKI